MKEKNHNQFVYQCKECDYKTHFDLRNTGDRDIVDFLKLQSKKIKTFRLAINILLLLFGKEDISNIYNDIEKYGLINILDSRLAKLKK